MKKQTKKANQPQIDITEMLNIDDFENLDTTSGELQSKMEQRELEDREIYLTGNIEREGVLTLIRRIRYLNKLSAEPITLYINSEGGSVVDGFALCDVIMSSQSPIMGYVQGSCMSMALAVLACCANRVAGRYAQFMCHSVRAEFGEMEQSDMFCQADYVRRLNEQMAEALCEASELSKQEWLEKIIGKETYFTSVEALDFGLIDEIM